MLETSRVTEMLEEARTYADKIGLRVQFEARLAYLDHYAEPKHTRCILFPDPAPYSFHFAMEMEFGNGSWMVWFEGRLIYHGPHDDHGSGTYPTLAVTPILGWLIRT